MSDHQEREFNLWLEVRVKGYGSRAQEDQMAERVASILGTRLHTDVEVSVVRDSDKRDTAPDPFRPSSEMPEVPIGAGGRLGDRMRRAGWQGGDGRRRGERGQSDGSPAMGCAALFVLWLAVIGGVQVATWFVRWAGASDWTWPL